MRPYRVQMGYSILVQRDCWLYVSVREVNGVQIGYVASPRFSLSVGKDSKLSCQERYLYFNQFELKFPCS
jgi:hypothetical protein